MALLAASYTHQGRTTFSEDICKRVSAFLTERSAVPTESMQAFREYVFRKPGSRRYTPLRRDLEKGQRLTVERQDLLLSDSALPSSVGALTQDYFDDALSLAHMLKMVKEHQNLLLARGRLSLSTAWDARDPFGIDDRTALYLGLWLLDIDGDWLWAFFSQLPDEGDFSISTENRVELLLRSWRHILSARQIRSGDPQNARVRTRLRELIGITERNVRERLNLGQPWSWFLIPRLELLVDAGILRKKERHGLSGYSVTATGEKFRRVCSLNEGGDALIENYFACHNSGGRQVADDVEWEAVEGRLIEVAPVLRTSVGYFPIFETASAVCVTQFVESAASGGPVWEIEGVKRRLWEESRAGSPRVRLAIDRRGQIYAFKIEGR